jgi:hypothetical protein
MISLVRPDGPPLDLEANKVHIAENQGTHRFVLMLNSKHVCQVSYGKSMDQAGASALIQKMSGALKAGFSKAQLKAMRANTEFDCLSPGLAPAPPF